LVIVFYPKHLAGFIAYAARVKQALLSTTCRSTRFFPKSAGFEDVVQGYLSGLCKG
jgi:hypothetical protein